MRYPEERPAGEPSLTPQHRLTACLNDMDALRHDALDLLRHEVPMREAEEIGRALNGISGAIAHARGVVEDQLGGKQH
jgi:hypothetical protein